MYRGEGEVKQTTQTRLSLKFGRRPPRMEALVLRRTISLLGRHTGLNLEIWRH